MINFKNSEIFYEGFIKTSQFLTTIINSKHFWKKLEIMVKKFFHADVFAFINKENQGTTGQHEITTEKEKLSYDLVSNSQKFIKDVFESGIFTSELVYLPEPYQAIFLPILKLNQIFGIMIIAHKTSELLPKEVLNIYLALGGLIENTYNKLITIEKMKNYQEFLEKAVEERTSELAETNKRLIAEIAATTEAVSDKDRNLKDCIKSVKRENIKEKMNQVQMKINMAQGSKDEGRVDSLLEEYNTLLKEYKIWR